MPVVNDMKTYFSILLLWLLLASIINYQFNTLYANEPPVLEPPAFSHPGGFYNNAFELELHTPYDGLYNYSVVKEGYATASGEILVTEQEVIIPVVLAPTGKVVQSANNIHESGVQNNKNGAFTVNFYVTMTDSPYVPGDLVYISGTMVDPWWPEPGSSNAMQMEKVNDDPLTYFISFNLDPGEYEYKYFLNPGWGDGEWSGDPNREVSVYGNTDFYDIWGDIDPDDPDDPDEYGLSTITFVIEDQSGQPVDDAIVIFDDVSQAPGDYVIEHVIPKAVIRYTTDGSIPNAASFIYSAPISITERTGDPNTISMIPTNNIGEGHIYNEHWQPPAGEVFKINSIRAATFVLQNTRSRPKTHSYLVHPDGTERYSLPLVSINAHAGAFFNPDSGIYVYGDHENYNQRGEEWERLVHLEFFETQGNLAFSQEMGARIHGGTSRNRPRKSLRMYARSDYGTTWVEYPLFPDKDIPEYKRFLLRNSGNDWGDAIFRDAFMQSLIEDLDLDIQYSRPAVLFINGEYWGIHNIRDRLDNRYLETHYGIDDDADYTILEGNAEFARGNPAGRQHYVDMINFINQQGLVSQENYDELQTRMDVENFADYQIAQIYFMNTDWPGNNLQYWRYFTSTYIPDADYGLDGRWRWQIFDADFGFGLNFDYVTGVEQGAAHNTLAFALRPNGPSWPNPPWSTLILRRLVENNDFRNSFILRFTDLLNTNFSESTVTQKLEDYRLMYLPEMPEHIDRWRRPPNMNYWEGEIEVMHNFALQRPDYLRQYLADEFNLDDLANLTVQSANPAQGNIRVNTVAIKGHEMPWTGQYFKGLDMEVEALPNPGYYFSYWEGEDIDEPTSPIADVNLDDDLSMVAHYQDALVHYWHFNNLSDENIAIVEADYSALESARITYPGIGDGYMDRTDGTLLNAHHGASAGYGLRVRNPSDTRMLLFDAPSTGYKNLGFSFAVHRTNNGAQQQTFHYSTDDGQNWTQLEGSYDINLDYEVISFDLSGIPEVNDNPSLQFKILFTGEAASNVDGNNRFDNIALSGTAIYLNIGETDPPPGFMDNTYPGHYFTASGGSPPYSYAKTGGSLPQGMSLSNSGLLSGTPEESGTFAFFVTVTDQEGATASNLFSLTIEAKSLIHYWHFNNLPDGTLTTVNADFYLTEENGQIIYPGTGSGYMDRTDGTLLNAKLNTEAGYGLRVRNPSNTRELIFHTPSTGYDELVFSFAVQRTNNGARQQSLYFSPDGGNTWTMVAESYDIGLPFAVNSFNLSAYPEVNNNPDLKMRILFEGAEASGDSGNNRFDNIALQGDPSALAVTEPSQKNFLKQNYPNPFKDTTTIPFELTQGGHVRIDVYNIQGVHVETLLDCEMPPGQHNMLLNAASYPEGIYIYKMQSNDPSASRRMMRIK
jgi:hypothetical protein